MDRVIGSLAVILAHIEHWWDNTGVFQKHVLVYTLCVAVWMPTAAILTLFLPRLVVGIIGICIGATISVIANRKWPYG